MTKVDKSNLPTLQAWEQQPAALNYAAAINIDLTADVEGLWKQACAHVEAHQRHYAAVGLLCLELKNKTLHGEFLRGLDKRGFDQRTAYRAMTYARYVFQQPENKQQQLLGLDVSKVCALAAADPEVVEALFEGDTQQLVDVSYRGLLKEMEALRKQLEASQQTKNDEATINSALNKKRGLGDLTPRTQVIRDEALAQQATADYGMSAIKKLWDEVTAESHGAPEFRERLEFLWFVAHGTAARVMAALHAIQESAPTDMPEHATTRHVLTPAEIEHWGQELAMIESGMQAKEAVRHERRQTDLPRSVGRPKGAKTATKSGKA